MEKNLEINDASTSRNTDEKGKEQSNGYCKAFFVTRKRKKKAIAKRFALHANAKTRTAKLYALHADTKSKREILKSSEAVVHSCSGKLGNSQKNALIPLTCSMTRYRFRHAVFSL